MARILVVDDDEQIRMMVTKMLERDGHKITIAEDGHVGLRLFQAEPPDLVIADIIMPTLEGIEMIKTMKQLRSDIPIVAVSGGARHIFFEDTLCLAQQAGAVATLSKPFTRVELTAALLTALSD